MDIILIENFITLSLGFIRVKVYRKMILDYLICLREIPLSTDKLVGDILDLD